jgi:hypothetical protein
MSILVHLQVVFPLHGSHGSLHERQPQRDAFFLQFYCLRFNSILTHNCLHVGRPKMISEAPLKILLWCKPTLKCICPLMGMWSIWSRLLCIICGTQPNCVEDGVFPIGLRYVGVIWCVLHILQLLPNLNFTWWNMCCIGDSTMKHHQKSTWRSLTDYLLMVIGCDSLLIP